MKNKNSQNNSRDKTPLWSHLTLQGRLIAIILTVTFFSLLLGFSISFVYDYRVSKVDLSTQALFVSNVLSELASDPLLEQQPEIALDILQKLQMEENILFCCIYDPELNEFAAYGDIPLDADFQFPFDKYGQLFHGSYLYVHKEVLHQDVLLGSVYVIFTTFEITSKMIKLLRNMVLISLFVLVFAVIAANRLQHSVSNPILHLVKVMDAVSQKGNYSVRVNAMSTDEIGRLYDGFNNMIGQIQKREKKQKAAELKITESEERYRLLVENQTDLIIKIDSQGRFLFVSPSYCEMFGKKYSDLIGTVFIPELYDEDAKATVKAIEKLKQPPYISYVEQRAMTAKGWRWLAWSYKAILDSKGQLLEIVADGRDVTEQKRAEIGLRKSEERFRTLFENMAQGVFYHRAKDNYIYNANRAALQILGLSITELQLDINQPSIIKFFQEDGNELLPKDFPSNVALRTGRQVRAKIVGFYHSDEHQYKWLTINAVPLFMSEENEPYEAFVTLDDITQIKQAQAEVRVKSRALDQSINGFHILSKDGKFVYVNKAYVKMWGYDNVDEILGTQASAHYNDSSILKTVSKQLESQDHYTAEFIAKRRDLSTFDVLLSTYIYQDEAGDTFYAGSSIDITQRKQAEQELLALNHQLEERVRRRTAQFEAANKDLEAFAYSVSHDLRAPLRHISGFTSIVETEMQTPPEGIQHYLNKIKNASKRMQTMIDDLLSFSRIGRKNIVYNTIRLRKVVEQIITDYEHDTEDRNITWKINLESTCRGDGNLIQLAMENLVSNALKFTTTKEQAIIEIGEKSLENNYVEIFVKDNGVGFDMEYMKNLFNVFQRLHSDEEFPGTGIGLANVKRIIEKHGGQVRAEGWVDQGAVFYISLPKEKI